MLRFEEILRLVKIMTELGIRKIRVTGGEPLLRRGISSFLKNLREISGIEKLTLTTNGLLLGKYLGEAEALGRHSLPDGVNISLDALDPERYNRISREANAGPAEILFQIDRLLEMNVRVKVNCVPVRGYNDGEILPLALLARAKNIAVRFIELMPFGSAEGFETVSGGETAALLEKTFGALSPFTGAGAEGSGPAVYYTLPGFTGLIGFINPLSNGFCEKCNRLRLTSEGFLKPCLSSPLDFNLRDLLRRGACDTELRNAIIEAAAKKPQFHNFSPLSGAKERRSSGMSGIGG
jgi:cyclic pyranopterin phosphate synthase